MNFLRDFWKELVAAWRTGAPHRDALWYYAHRHISAQEFAYLDKQHPDWFEGETECSDELRRTVVRKTDKAEDAFETRCEHGIYWPDSDKKPYYCTYCCPQGLAALKLPEKPKKSRKKKADDAKN